MIFAILYCACGHAPRLVRRGDYCWYTCRACNTTGPKALTIPLAAAGWNERRQKKETT